MAFLPHSKMVRPNTLQPTGRRALEGEGRDKLGKNDPSRYGHQGARREVYYSLPPHSRLLFIEKLTQKLTQSALPVCDDSKTSSFAKASIQKMKWKICLTAVHSIFCLWHQQRELLCLHTACFPALKTRVKRTRKIPYKMFYCRLSHQQVWAPMATPGCHQHSHFPGMLLFISKDDNIHKMMTHSTQGSLLYTASSPNQPF